VAPTFVWYGFGEVNFEEHVKALKSIDYQGFATIEYETWITGSLGINPHNRFLDQVRIAKEAYSFAKAEGF
jgi:sugar phosphate isomerase/epimerase